MRRSLSPDAYTEASRDIVERIRALPEYRTARRVHSYWPVVEQHEVDIRPLLDELVVRDVRVVLPVVREFGPPSGSPRLKHVEYQPGIEMRPNRWKILEPVDGAPVPLDEIDLILVPALACDTTGMRLGHGLGYYDEFLPRTTGMRLCPCMDSFVTDSLPAGPHDQRVDIIVTETRVIRTR